MHSHKLMVVVMMMMMSTCTLKWTVLTVVGIKFCLWPISLCVDSLVLLFVYFVFVLYCMLHFKIRFFFIYA